MSMLTFADGYAFAETRCELIDTIAIKGMIPNCARVLRADRKLDRRGVDYVAELDSGVRLAIDAKARTAGTRKYWSLRGGVAEPDLQLETWSVLPDAQNRAVIGWTLDPAKLTDLVLFTFDPVDCDRCYLIGFHHLRAAFVAHRQEWGERYKTSSQRSERWRSECMFVPVTVVQRAIQRISVGQPSVLKSGSAA